MPEPRVIVVGGGLAGLVVTREMRLAGVPVLLLESSDRLGGKAGSHRNASDPQYWEDHGYHIFPAWYVNTRRLLKELGCERSLIELDRVHFLKRGRAQYCTLYAPSIRNAWRNLTSGLVPWWVAALGCYAALDVASTTFHPNSFLDRVSFNGFLWKRFYVTNEVALAHQGFVLQASAIPTYVISAMTASNVLASYLRKPNPMQSILVTNLQAGFIDPLVRSLQGGSAAIRLNSEIRRLRVEGEPGQKRVTALELAGGERVAVGEEDLVVLATPQEVTFQFVDSEIVEAEEDRPVYPVTEKRLADYANFESVPMAAMHVYFRRRLPGLPREHVMLYQSRYELSFIDLSQSWPDYPDRTVLSVISSNFEPLLHLTPLDAGRELLRELRAYLHFELADVDDRLTSVQPHVREPLFLNTVGSWTYRPNSKTRLANLYVAGDYCRSKADLTTMESAVESALVTAKDILTQLKQPVRCPRRPIPHYPKKWLRVWLALGFVPVVVLRLCVALLQGWRKLVGAPAGGVRAPRAVPAPARASSRRGASP
jgi:hypothetical protein